MERLTLRDDDGRALLTPYGLRIYCSTQATADCICKLEEALQAQEPRVMTLAEVSKCSMCWLEDDMMLAPALFIGMERRANGTKSDVFLANAQDSDDCEFWYDLDDYGTKWRCWTGRPTDEQREAVKREKVIKGLECCATNRLHREDCEAMDCVYLELEGHGCIHQLIRDALALLKAQKCEPEKAYRDA